MSWIYAVLGSDASGARLPPIHSTAIFELRYPGFHIAAGGIPETCLYGQFDVQEKGASGWLVVGLGIQRHSGYCTFVSNSQWERILSQEKPELSSLDGHFVAVRWHNDRLECFTDQLGMRTLFAAQCGKSIAVSTRLDWLSRLKGGSEIAFEEFGAHWMTFNQFSYESMDHGINRVGPGGTLVCTGESFTIHNTPWMFGGEKTSDEELCFLLQAFLNPRLSETLTVSFGLSGGLDSRLLLALLQSSKRQVFLHLFGHLAEPDVRVAQRIAADERLQQQFYPQAIPSSDTCISRLREYVCETSLVGPASTMLKTAHYEQMHTENKVVIDGGMGEIARRQFMNRLLWKGRRALKDQKPAALLRYVGSPRAHLFEAATTSAMQRGAELQLTRMWDEMPRIEEIGVENFLDLMVVRYRYPNYAGLDQSRMDEQIVGWMPFSQPSFIRATFGLPLAKKKNGRLFRQLIRQHCSQLMSYPLVKGTTTYPYILPTVPAWAYTKAKSYFKTPFADPTPIQFLSVVSEFVQDTVRSASVKSYAHYDYRSIIRHVDEFYAGRLEHAGFVEWWLAFELWRQSLSA